MSKKFMFLVRIIVAVILLQTLRFKFTAHPDSVFIFSKIGMEPYGRIGVGILELIAGLLILIRPTIWMGSILSVGLMSAALLSHVTLLGVEVNGDGGKLFYMAVLVFTLSVWVSWTERKKIPYIRSLF